MRIEFILAEIVDRWPWLWPVLFIVLGGVAGSFMTCMGFRLARGLPLRQPPSYCPACRHTLKVWELVPVLSWLWLRGKCSRCGAPIGWASVAVEGVTIAEAVLPYFIWGPSWQVLVAVPVLWSLTFSGLFWWEKHRIH